MAVVPSVYVAQGEFAVSTDPECVIAAVLGSCVAACLWDPVARVGGMNHILLPNSAVADQRWAAVGANAMELLINGLIHAGADSTRFQAKVFGGARMIAGLSDIGQKNAEFVRDFLDREQIPLISESLGGTCGRRVQFWPVSGRARQLMLKDRAVPVQVPVEPPPSPAEVELF